MSKETFHPEILEALKTYSNLPLISVSSDRLHFKSSTDGNELIITVYDGEVHFDGWYEGTHPHHGFPVTNGYDYSIPNTPEGLEDHMEENAALCAEQEYEDRHEMERLSKLSPEELAAERRSAKQAYLDTFLP